jgi:hypothetical protein
MKRRWFSIAAILLLSATTLLLAQEEEKISIYGFGSWAYAKTDGNQYLWSENEGSWSFNDFALNIDAQVDSKLRVNAQLYHNSFLHGKEFNLDHAFAEYAISDSFKIKAGLVKQPFGLYGELKRVSTTRPFFTLPVSLYDSEFFIAAAYSGVGITGNLELSRDWLVRYDLYTGSSRGSLTARSATALINYLYGGQERPEHPEDVNIMTMFDLETKNLYGARVEITNPISGLSIVGSYAQSYLEGFLKDTNIIGYETDVRAAALSVNYEYGNYLLKGEIADIDIPGIFRDYIAYYVEAGYFFSESLQAVFRLEDFQGESYSNNPMNQALFEKWSALIMNKELAVGLNYYLNSNLIFRASVHWTDGLIWAAPAEGLKAFIDDEVNDDTVNFIAGVCYSF